MIIAVNLKFYTAPGTSNDADFMVACFSILSINYPQHQFVFFADKFFKWNELQFSKNCSVVVSKSKIKNPLLLLYWLNFKLPMLLKKHKAAILINGGGVCSLFTKLPQCMVMQNLYFLSSKNLYTSSWLRFYKKYTSKFLSKANTIIATSLFLKEQLVKQYQQPPNKIDVAYQCPNTLFKPITLEQKEIIKNNFTRGKEYFLYTGSIHPQQNLLALLKAFSFFKRRQKSNMQLVLATKDKSLDDVFTKKLSTYKFKDEVILLENLPTETIAQITAAAYTVVLPSTFSDNAIAALEAIQCNVPVLTKNTNAILEICANAAVNINPTDFNDIAEKMMLIFKDENFRTTLIKNAQHQKNLFIWDKTIAQVWGSVLKCTNF